MQNNFKILDYFYEDTQNININVLGSANQQMLLYPINMAVGISQYFPHCFFFKLFFVCLCIYKDVFPIFF
jgi:hypothetical protein